MHYFSIVKWKTKLQAERTTKKYIAVTENKKKIKKKPKPKQLTNQSTNQKEPPKKNSTNKQKANHPKRSTVIGLTGISDLDFI